MLQFMGSQTVRHNLATKQQKNVRDPDLIPGSGRSPGEENGYPLQYSCLYGRKFVTLYRRQGSRPFPRKRNAKRQNGCLRGLTNSCEKKRSKRQRRKGKVNPFECRVPKNSEER